MTAHVHRYRHYHNSGHVYQRRFRSFPVQEDDRLPAVPRYVDRKPVRAGLVRCAGDWPWSSAAPTRGGGPPLDPGPVPRPADWPEYVDAPRTEAEAEAMRECIRRRRPYGEAVWMEGAALRLGLEASLRPRGRPRKQAGDPPSPLGRGGDPG